MRIKLVLGVVVATAALAMAPTSATAESVGDGTVTTTAVTPGPSPTTEVTVLGGNWAEGQEFPIEDLGAYGISPQQVMSSRDAPPQPNNDPTPGADLVTSEETAQPQQLTQLTDADTSTAGYEGSGLGAVSAAKTGSPNGAMAVTSGMGYGCTATSNYTSYSSWLDKQGSVVRLRYGYWNATLDRGFGFCKVMYKHNLTPAVLRTVTKNYRDKVFETWISPTRIAYYLKAYKVECGYFTCRAVAWTDVKVSYDRRLLSDSRHFGVVTAFCAGVVWCPEYVKNALNTQ